MIVAQEPQPVRAQHFPRETLLWKELSENKAQIVWSSVILVALLMGASLLSYLNGNQSDSTGIHNDAIAMLVVAWCISGAITSSSTISPEINGSRLQFLTSLPLRRSTIWWTKMGSALLLHVLSLIAMTLIFIAISGVITPPSYPANSSPQSIAPLEGLPWYTLLLSLLVFAVGSVVTMFTDRALSAFFACIITSSVEVIGLLMIQSSVDWGHIGLVVATGVTLTVVQLAISYKIFVYGETLRTSKRVSLLVDSLLFDILPVVVALTIAYLWISY